MPRPRFKQKSALLFLLCFLIGAVVVGTAYLVQRTDERARAYTNDNQIYTSVNLSPISAGTVGLRITYDNASAVGYPYPNYEYPSQIVKMGTNNYRMYYGGRCYYDVNGNCQIPNGSGTYPSANPIGGDGDHPRLATSTNGLNWSTISKPLLRKGQYDSPPAPVTNYDYGNKMDPSVIKWGNTYYMYYQVEYTNYPVNCPRPVKPVYVASDACGKILYATSNDGLTWTKPLPLGVRAITNDTLNDDFNWPKALVVDNKVWLYFTRYKRDANYSIIGFENYLIKSNDPKVFNYNDKVRLTPDFGGIGQPAILWPNDLTKRLFVIPWSNWSLSSTGYIVPTLMFSKNGVNWTQGSGPYVSFPPVMRTTWHTFCSVGAELNGGLNSLSSNPNRIDTFYSCSTSNGQNCRAEGSSPNLPFGYLETPACDYLRGWAWDQDSPNSPIAIQIFADGPVGQGRYVAYGVADIYRADVKPITGDNGNHGYKIKTPNYLKDGHPHTLYAYGINTDGSANNALLINSGQSLTCATVPPTPTSTGTPTPIPIPPSSSAVCQTEAGRNHDIWHSNIAVGTLSFCINPADCSVTPTPTATPTPTQTPTPTSTPTPYPSTTITLTLTPTRTITPTPTATVTPTPTAKITPAYTCGQTIKGQTCVTGTKQAVTCVPPNYTGSGTGTCPTGTVCCNTSYANP